MAKKKELFKDLPPTLILPAHFKSEEVAQLRKDIESHGAQVTDSIFQAELVITKLSQEKRIRREIQDLARQSVIATTSATKEIDVVKEKWVRKCLQENGLVDWPFTDNTWLITRLVALPPVTPPKRNRSPDQFAVPGTPASKRRTLSQSDQKQDKSPTQTRPALVSAASLESASSDDPTSKHYHAVSQTSTNASSEEEDDKFDYREVYACRRKSPLICRNEEFVKLLVEIKLARELALYISYMVMLMERPNWRSCVC